MKSTHFARPAMMAVAVATLATLAACSNPSQIHTRDGRAIPTADRPEVDEDTGFVNYEKDGKEMQINKSEVREIEEIK